MLPLAAPAEQPASDGLPGVEVTAAAPAVRLFVERAQAVAPDLVLDAGTAPTVAAICRRLDGMPLAIELAAARVALLRPAALLRRLEHRLPLLTGGPTDLPERQQTLRQTLAWSHDLLGPAEQALFRRLAVFSGSCTLDAATAVCGALAGGSVAGAEEEVLAGVSALLDQSLLRREGAEDAGGEPRVGMLETIREYGRERLEDSGEADAVRGAHAAYYLALAEAASPHLRGPEQASWLTRLEADHANLRAALAWAQEQAAAETGLRLAVALTQFWALRGYFYEGRAWLSGLLRVPGGAPALRARALGAAGVLAYEQTDYDGAIALLGEAVALSGSLEAAGEAVHWRVLRDEAWSIRRGDAAGGVALLEASVALFGAAGDRPGLARAVMRLGFELWLRGEHRHARAALEEGVAAYRALGDAQGLVLALLYLSIVVREQGDYARATAVAEEAVARARALDARHALAWALVGLSDVALYQGAWERVDPPAEESLALFRALGVGMGAAFALHTLAQAAHGRGDLAQARTRLAESEVLAEAQGVGAGRAEIRHSQGLLARDTGDWAVAWALMAEGLAQCAAGGVLRHVPRSLEGLASVLVLQAGSGAAGARAMAVRAARLLAAATAQRAARGTPLPPAERPAYARAVAGVRALLGEAATAAAWAAGERLAPEQAVAEALGESPAG